MGSPVQCEKVERPYVHPSAAHNSDDIDVILIDDVRRRGHLQQRAGRVEVADEAALDVLVDLVVYENSVA
jgi:hypothetical protein